MPIVSGYRIEIIAEHFTGLWSHYHGLSLEIPRRGFPAVNFISLYEYFPARRRLSHRLEFVEDKSLCHVYLHDTPTVSISRQRRYGCAKFQFVRKLLILLLNSRQKGGFPDPNFVFLEADLSTRRKCSYRLKLRVGAIATTTALIQWRCNDAGLSVMLDVCTVVSRTSSSSSSSRSARWLPSWWTASSATCWSWFETTSARSTHPGWTESPVSRSFIRSLLPRCTRVCIFFFLYSRCPTQRSSRLHITDGKGKS